MVNLISQYDVDMFAIQSKQTYSYIKFFFFESSYIKKKKKSESSYINNKI